MLSSKKSITKADDSGVLAALSAVGITPENHSSLGELAVSTANSADELSTVFDVLLQAGATPNSHPSFYERAIKCTNAAHYLAQVFAVLKNAGLRLEDNPLTYEKAIELTRYSRVMPTKLTVFSFLVNAGITAEDHYSFFCKALTAAGLLEDEDADNLSHAFEVLRHAGITPERHPSIYKSAINNAKNAGKFHLACEARRLECGNPGCQSERESFFKYGRLIKRRITFE